MSAKDVRLMVLARPRLVRPGARTARHGIGPRAFRPTTD